MYSLVRLWRIVWIAGIVLHAILLAFLVRRKSYQDFPAFVLFTIWAVTAGTGGIVLFIMDQPGVATGAEYYQGYCIAAAGDAILSFAVLYELFKRILRDYPTLSTVGQSLYRWATLLLVALAVGLTWSAPASGSGTLMATFFAMQRTVRLLECGLLVFLFIFARSFGLSWRNCAFGIALGLGIAAAVSLATSAIRSQVESARTPATPAAILMKNVFTLVNQVGDLSAVVVWMKYLLTRETVSTVSLPVLPPHDLETWNEEVRRFVP